MVAVLWFSHHIPKVHAHTYSTYCTRFPSALFLRSSVCPINSDAEKMVHVVWERYRGQNIFLRRNEQPD